MITGKWEKDKEKKKRNNGKTNSIRKTNSAFLSAKNMENKKSKKLAMNLIKKKKEKKAKQKIKEIMLKNIL